MTEHLQPERFHALDATRAFALLLGVVFHAAWSFTAEPFGGAIVDSRGSTGFYWFFFTSHTFRMQLFFLVAGFFAHMVCHRKGFGHFARNRLMRIGVPFVVGWLILFPLVNLAFKLGANVSGRHLVEIPLSTVASSLYRQGLMFIPTSAGGMFSLAHLWFLYYLLWLSALAIIVRLFLTRSGTVAERLRTWADAGVRRVMESSWSIVVLSVGTGFFLWPMQGWFGVDTPFTSLAPSSAVLTFYGLFFVFGWLLHRQAHLLGNLARHWRWQIALGLVLSLPVFGIFKGTRNAGAVGMYPRLVSNHFADWPAFLARLQSATNAATAPAGIVSLWDKLAPPARERILAMTADARPDERVGVAATVGKLLTKPDLFSAGANSTATARSSTSVGATMVKNRTELERLFAGSITGNQLAAAWYRPLKLGYSIGYCLVMWLLLFGTLGFFQARCIGHSALWRYLADSSYWVYLIHLPLVLVLQVWVAPWPVPGILKFAFLNALAFVILYASYHYMARSTFIGQILNGRKYPLVAWPFARNAVDAKESSAMPNTGALAVEAQSSEASCSQ